jgi:formylglycine-generating enzyme required for sulfatase activity
LEVAPGQLVTRKVEEMMYLKICLMMCLETAMVMTACNSDNPVSSDASTVNRPGMRAITGGTFQMGSENGRPDEKPVHKVTVSSFFMDTTEVTQADYQTLMKRNPSYYQGEQQPVEMVTWFDAVLYCNARSKRDKLDTVYKFDTVTFMEETGCTDLQNLTNDFSKNGYRLPTEAEWEYACRAGTTTNYYWGNQEDSATMNKYMWTYFNGDNTTHPVAQKLPNPWGLYDMGGNVWQLCHDFYDAYNAADQTDPTGPATGNWHVGRGGTWLFMIASWTVGDLVRPSSRWGDDPNKFMSTQSPNQGFRCVCNKP